MLRFYFHKFLYLQIILGLFTSNVFAVSILKEVKKNNENIQIIFDNEIHPRDIKVEFLRDIIQFSISKTNVYPAKISSFNEGEIKKIFAYQYSPQLIRIRFTVDGQAENFKNNFSYKINKNIISAQVTPKVIVKEKTELKAAIHLTDKKNEEKIQKTPESSIPIKRSSAENSPLLQKKESNELTLKNQFFKVMARLGVIVLLVLLTAIFYKKYLSSKKNKKNFKKENSLQTFFGNFFTHKLKLGNSFMEIIATHHLAPKKSIIVVKIKDETLVLGVSDESINLITKMNSKMDQKTSDPEVDFGNIFMNEMKSPEIKKPVVNAKNHSMISDEIRDKIRKKIGAYPTI